MTLGEGLFLGLMAADRGSTGPSQALVVDYRPSATLTARPMMAASLRHRIDQQLCAVDKHPRLPFASA